MDARCPAAVLRAGMGDFRAGAVPPTAPPPPPAPRPPLAEPQRAPDKGTPRGQHQGPGPAAGGRALTSPPSAAADAPNACFLCIKAKTPCDGKTPCSRCARLNVAHMCLKPNSLLAKAGLPTVQSTGPETDALRGAFAPPASALSSDADTIQRTNGGFRFNALTGQKAYPPQGANTTAIARTGGDQPASQAQQPPLFTSQGGTLSAGGSAHLGNTSSQTSRPDSVYVLQELSSMRREHRRLINEVKLLRFQNERLERNLETAKQEAEAERLHQKVAELRERSFFSSPNRCTYPVFVSGFPTTATAQGPESTRFSAATGTLPENILTPGTYMPHSSEAAPKPQHPEGSPRAQPPNPVIAAAVNAILSNKAIDFHNDAVVQRFQRALESSAADETTTTEKDSVKTTTTLSPEGQEFSPPLQQPVQFPSETALADHGNNQAGSPGSGNSGCFGAEKAIVSASQFSPRFRQITEDERCQQLHELQRVQTGAANISDIRSQAMVVFDLRTNPPLVSEVTALFAHLLGYKPSELLHEPWYKLIDESLYDATMNNLNKCLRNNSNCSVVHQLYLRKDGALLESIDTHQFVIGLDGRPLYDIIVVKPVGFTTHLSGSGSQALVSAQRCPPETTQNALAIPSTSYAPPYSPRGTPQSTPQFITVDPGVFAMLSNRAQQPQPQPQLLASYQPQPQVATAAVPDAALGVPSCAQPVFPKPSAIRRVRPSPVQVRPSTAPPAQRLRLSPPTMPQQSATEPSFLPLPSPASMSSTRSTPLQQCDAPELGIASDAAATTEPAPLEDDAGQTCFCSSEPLTSTLPAPEEDSNPDALFATETGTPAVSLSLPPPPPTPVTETEQVLPPLPPPQAQPLTGLDTTAATATAAAPVGEGEECVKDDLGVVGDQGGLGFSPLGLPTPSGDVPGLLSPSGTFNTFLYPY